MIRIALSSLGAMSAVVGLLVLGIRLLAALAGRERAVEIDWAAVRTGALVGEEDWLSERDARIAAAQAADEADLAHVARIERVISASLVDLLEQVMEQLGLAPEDRAAVRERSELRALAMA